MKLKLQAIAAVMFLTIYYCGAAWSQLPQSAADDNLRVVTFQDLEYPPGARAARVQGTVVVRVDLDDQGKVTDATALSGSGWLTRSVVTNVKTWVFRPNAKKTGVVVYNFTILPGVCGVHAGSLFVLQENVATVVTCPPVPMP